ncbi:hypothetical protein SBRV1_gp47 [Sulfolobales Beppu rod-shaped virus 1]|uniref:Uncharacterized protein n=1 Tax=Sulfolobales Beppu rod-shaped virus 1 TaxID=2493121 RepID=A0A3Q8Q444_9VIRU|nr:hypothetical protein QIT32_gp47 [Sulfolobales Beppu rod-shaped virus 1]AZI75936.1 hypothetical protein SBRV1_gp47 [Sulfolobales Beppu rod-shaped virus 1]
MTVKKLYFVNCRGDKMKIITFVGYTQHLNELDFDYLVVDKYFNTLTDEQYRDYKDRIIFHDTNEPNLRLRINKQLRKIIEILEKEKDDQFAIVDSDLIIPNLRKISAQNSILSPCYYALHKGKNYIEPWCFGTNFIFDSKYLNLFKIVIYSYNDPNESPDGYIHFHLLVNHIIIPKTKHYIKTENGEIEKIITEFDWLETIKHNFVPVQVINI